MLWNSMSRRARGVGDKSLSIRGRRDSVEIDRSCYGGVDIISPFIEEGQNLTSFLNNLRSASSPYKQCLKFGL
jgi:hypothetical protein